MSIKGYPSQQKDERLKSEFATVEPLKTNQQGLSVTAHAWVYLVGADAVEANSTTSVINATAHVALKGDLIRFTSGTFNNREFVVSDTTANTITLAETLTSAPVLGVTFEIQRRKAPLVGADGSIPVSATVGPVQYVLDGVDTEVEEDTVTPANNRPLPVKVMDGTDTLAINAGGEALVTASQSGTWNVGITGAIPLPAGAATEATLSALNTKIPAQGAALIAASVPVNIASNQTVPVSAASLPLPTGAATEATLATLATEATLSSLSAKFSSLGQKVMASSAPVVIASDQSAIPASQSGTWNITNVSGTVSLPTGASTEATLTTLNGKVANDYGVSSGAVRTASQIGNATGAAAFGSGTSSAQTLRVTVSTNDVITTSAQAISVVDLMDTPLLIASSTNIPASASNPLQVVASLAAAVKKIQIYDTTGEFIGVYTGAALSEVLLFVAGPGTDQTIDVNIASTTRISLRNMKNAAVTVGEFAMNFIG